MAMMDGCDQDINMLCLWVCMAPVYNEWVSLPVVFGAVCISAAPHPKWVSKGCGDSGLRGNIIV
eukprot:6120187-Ditylum_brightwellii.AAC.1